MLGLDNMFGRIRMDRALAAGLALVTALVFFPALAGGFLFWDDQLTVYGNAKLTGLDWPTLSWAFTEIAYVRFYIPLMWLSLAISRQLSGLEPFGYHAVNFAFHVFNSFLVFAVTRKLLELAFRPENALTRERLSLAAALGAGFWALHPLRAEVVGWVSARSYGQALGLVLASLLFHLRAVESGAPLLRSRGYWAGVACFAGSLLTYPQAIGFSLVIVVLDIYPLRRKIDWREKAPYLAVAALVTGITLWARTHAGPIWAPPLSLAEFPLFARTMQVTYVWFYYVWKSLLPFGLSAVYTRLIGFNPLDFAFLSSAAAVLGITFLAYRLRGRYPGFLGLWFSYLVLLIPSTGFTEFPHFTNDRYSYIPSVCLSLLISGGLLRAWTNPRRELGAKAVAGGLAALLALFTLASTRQTARWKDNPTFFHHVLHELGDDPYQSDIWWRLGQTYMDSGEPDKALQAFDETLRRDPEKFHARAFRGLIRLKEKRFQEAALDFGVATKVRRDALAAYYLGVSLVELGRIDEGKAAFELALEIRPDFKEARERYAALGKEPVIPEKGKSR